MKTLITMQRIGCKNHPKWRFVIRGQKKSIKGRYIEEVGLWIPQKRKTVQRSLIFNKPRILYWLGMGAQPTHRVKIFLSYIGYMPDRIDFYGNLSKYQEQKEVHRTYNVWQERFPKARKYDTQIQILQRKQEEDNKIMREHLIVASKFEEDNPQLLNSLQDTVQTLQRQELERVKQGFSEIPYEIDERTKQFYQLRQLLDRCENDKKYDSDLQVVYDRLNKLSEKGIMDYQRYMKYVVKDVDEDQKIDLLSADQQHRYLRRRRLEEMLTQAKQRQEEHMELLKPLSQAQTGQFLINELRCGQQQAMEITYELFKSSEVRQEMPTKLDILEMMGQLIDPELEKNGDNVKFIAKRIKKELEAGEGYIPVVNTIHEFPQLNIYNPEEYYDTSKHNRGMDDDFMTRLNYDKAYTCDGITEIAKQRQSSAKIRKRMTHQKRVTKSKRFYSTTQGLSIATSNHLYHMNMFQEMRYTLNGF